MVIDDEKSSIEPLTPPKFKGTIPAHMLAKMDDADRYLFGTVSEMEEREKWLMEACKKNREHIIRIDEMSRTVYRWMQTVTSRWGVVVGLFLIALPVIIKTVVEIWLKP